jgi:hypothetical protein
MKCSILSFTKKGPTHLNAIQGSLNNETWPKNHKDQMKSKSWATSRAKQKQFRFYLAPFKSDPTVRIIYKGIKQGFKWQM